LPAVIFAVSLIPPAITTSQPHALRGFLVLGGSLFISSLGAGVLLSIFKQRSIRVLATVTYVVVLAIFCLRFLNIYHNKYVSSAYLDWQVHHKLMGQAVREIENDYDAIYIGDGLGGVSMLWNLRIDPQLYLASENKTTIGKYHFGVVPTQKDLQKKILYVTAQETQGKLVQELYLPNGRKAYNLWEL
jgi:hypothetical protein